MRQAIFVKDQDFSISLLLIVSKKCKSIDSLTITISFNFIILSILYFLKYAILSLILKTLLWIKLK